MREALRHKRIDRQLCHYVGISRVKLTSCLEMEYPPPFRTIRARLEMRQSLSQTWASASLELREGASHEVRSNDPMVMWWAR